MNDDVMAGLGYKWDSGSVLQCSSSINQTAMMSSNEDNSIFSSKLDPGISVQKCGESRGSLVVCPSQIDCYYTDGLLESQAVSGMSNLLSYAPNRMNIESVADVPCTSSASFAATVGLFPVAGYVQRSSHPVPDEKRIEDALTSQKSFNSCKRARREDSIQKKHASGLYGKRRGTVPSTITNSQLGQCKADNILEQQDEKKDKCEQNTAATLHSKTIIMESKSSQTLEAQVGRAKRGQATSAHSLAERLRRERINERMKFLQDLVPGCSKVTGKAVMLDEIINYVQSLQRQVELLSMKVATVYPEMKVDIEKLLLQDIHCSQYGTRALSGPASAMTSAYSIFPEEIQEQFSAIYNSNLLLPLGGMVSNVWHQRQNNSNENCPLSNPALQNPEPSGSHHG